MMIIGETMIMPTGGVAYYSTPFMRGASNVVCAVDTLVFEGGSLTLTINIQHKNSADTSWATIATFSVISGTGYSQKTPGTLKEMLRLEYALAAGSAGDFAVVYTYPPTWKPSTV